MATAILTGCTGLNNQSVKEKSKDLNLQISKSSQQQINNVANSATMRVQQITGKLDLKDALIAVQNSNPILQSLNHNIRAAKAAVRKNGVFPNPKLKADFDEVGGTGEYAGNDTMTSTIKLSQKIELGGKRNKRIFLAEQELEIAKLELAEIKLNLNTKVYNAFLSVYAAQENKKLVKSNFDIVEKNYKIVIKRIKSGDLSPVQKNKAKVELVSAKIAVTRAKRQLNIARKKLVGLWGESVPKFSEVSQLKININEKLTIDDFEKKLKNHPTVLKLQAKIARERASIMLNEAKAWSDIEINGGISNHNENDDESYSIGFSIPLPIFNQNKAGIEEAKAILDKRKSEQKMFLLKMKLNLAITYDELISTKEELKTLTNEIIPASEASYKSILSAFEIGEQSFLDVLDTQRTLIDAKLAKLNMMIELKQLIIKLNGIVGKHK